MRWLQKNGYRLLVTILVVVITAWLVWGAVCLLERNAHGPYCYALDDGWERISDGFWHDEDMECYHAASNTYGRCVLHEVPCPD